MTTEDEKTKQIEEQMDVRVMGFTQMERHGFVIYDAFRHPLLTVDNKEWPPKVIHIYCNETGKKWEYIPKEV